MLKMIKTVPPPGALWAPFELPVLDTDSDAPYVVRDIPQGLGPVEATVNTQDYGSNDGAFFTGTHLVKRNIVIFLALNDPDESRPDLYLNGFMPGSNVTLQFLFTEGAYPFQPVYIDGWVEKCEPNHFSQDPEMQISIICPNPDFYAEAGFPTGQAMSAVGVHPDTDVLYEGNRGSGFVLYLEFDGAPYVGDVIVELSLNSWGSDYRKIELNDLDLSGGMLEISTRQGAKYISLGGDSLVGARSSDSNWLTLYPGISKVRVRTPGDSVTRNWTMIYTEHYGGI